MIRALSTAATGLEAQASNIEKISNDLANVNTDGYKRARNEFQDLMYETVREPGAVTGSNSQSPVGVQTGMGVKVGAAHKIFEQGPARMTNNPFDMMIEGNGFLPVQKPNGEIAYTRAGAFHIDNQGRMVNSQGAMLLPQITVPSNAMGVTIGGNGEVKATLPNAGEAILGQIQLITFINEQGLMAQGNGLYKATSASGGPLQGIPGEDGLGTLQQGALEGSNVNVANSMVEMIQTQRAYEMNTKVMGVADQMLGATANISH
ncbi:MAG: flagellar basal-body rod protein FlgG [Methylotenera sp.]|nr:flagellar basal-body rod protein FlgG [Oligoflexia bacterium]